MNPTKKHTLYSNNPKMGQPYAPQGKGYADGGLVFKDKEDPIRKLQVSGGGQAIKGGIAGGGRVGYEFDTGNNSSLTVGVAGSGVKTKDTKDFKVTGADVSYRKGDTTIGVEATKGRYTPDPMGAPGGSYDPDEKRVMFKFTKEF